MNIISSIKTVFTNQTGKIKNIYNSFNREVSSVGKKIAKKLQKFIDILMNPPKDKNDYVKLGKFYFSKRFVIIASIVVVVLGFVIVKYAYPWADGHLWTATVKVNSDKYNSFSGRAKVKNYDGRIIYIGDMADGKITGKGTQYDLEGNVVYIGQFENGEYSGEGEQYSNGIVIYSGMFSKSLYEGEGKLYDSQGKLIYSGSFSVGQKSGKGVEYDASTGNKLYYGDFVSNLREGKGTEYTLDNRYTLYEGDFVAGKYEGSGRLYEEGKLKYQGDFVGGVFEGKGTLYDIATNHVIYEGEFAAGKYNGEGTLYDPTTTKIIYKGNFEGGFKSGEGSSYDRFGGISFNGEFKDDNVNYINYMGKSLEDVKSEFGKENYQTSTKGKTILTYLGLNVSLVFKADEDTGSYVCEKVVMGNKYTFMGLGAKSSSEDVKNVMGSPYSSIKYSFADYYATIFKQLSINLSSSDTPPSDKFIMDGYFIRFYYNQNKTQILAVEVSSV